MKSTRRSRRSRSRRTYKRSTRRSPRPSTRAAAGRYARSGSSKPKARRAAGGGAGQRSAMHTLDFWSLSPLFNTRYAKVRNRRAA